MNSPEPQSVDLTRYLPLLERRLALFESLAAVLAEFREKFIAMDFDAIGRSVAAQEELCATIRSLDAELAHLQKRAPNSTLAGMLPESSASASGDSTGKRIAGVCARLASIQAAVRKANAANQSMIRRSERTVRCLANFFASHAPTYANPVQPDCARCEERA